MDTTNPSTAALWFWTRRPSVKVLFFVDSEDRYEESRKALSVLLNPSAHSYPNATTFLSAPSEGAPTSANSPTLEAKDMLYHPT